MTINLNFNLEAWVRQLHIEAESVEAAKEKLMQMPISEILQNDTLSIDSEVKLTEIDATEVEYDLVVKATNIKYDLDPEEMSPQVIAYLEGFLPSEKVLKFSYVTDDDDIEELIKDELFADTNYQVKSVEFQILEKK